MLSHYRVCRANLLFPARFQRLTPKLPGFMMEMPVTVRERAPVSDRHFHHDP
jgi:hypothetical protein